MKVSVIQMNMREGDTEYNFSHAGELLTEAAKKAPDVIVLPETWNTGFFPTDNLSEAADVEGNRTKALLAEISSSYNVFIIGGSVTEKKNDGIYNSCYIYDDKGRNISSYSKIHLFSPMKENEYYNRGDKLCIFSVAGVRAAVIICYDLRFPELARSLALSGAEMLFVPSQWPRERIAQMEILLRGRAVENQMYVVSANSCATFGKTVFGGNSMLVDPMGNIIAKGQSDEEIITVDIDIQSIRSIRNEINVFADRREDIY